ncbi:hypothetical protein BDW22DRAFT_1015526 [Trametopsis cervina]|nr:hypothetical protein BDW22DRAFT_1015526 [Trametopsis cervina]
MPDQSSKVGNEVPDGNLATTYALIYSFLNKQAHTKAAEAVKKAAKDVIVLKEGTGPDATSLDEIVRKWKALSTSSDKSDSSSSSDSDSSSSSDSEEEKVTKPKVVTKKLTKKHPHPARAVRVPKIPVLRTQVRMRQHLRRNPLPP